MLRGHSRPQWRRGFALYRRRSGTDARGEEIVFYDMEHPDFETADGSPEGVCWQSVKSWQSVGRQSAGVEQMEEGERFRSVAEGFVFSDLALAEYDRIRLEEGLYEIREIQHWPSCRLVRLRRIE